MSLNFCDESGCLEFAQSDDPAAPNLLLFKCTKHEGRILRYADAASSSSKNLAKHSRSPRPAQAIPDRGGRCDVEVLSSGAEVEPAEVGSPIFGVLAGIAGMAIGTRELVLSDVAIEQIGNATTIKIKQISIRTAASSALTR